MAHDIASHLVEQIVVVAPGELYGQILEEHLKPHLLTMSLHPIANFILQRVISSAHTKEQVRINQPTFSKLIITRSHLNKLIPCACLLLL